MIAVADRLLHWFDRHGRHTLPWQHPRTPYRVWLSEVMLQQTQVSTVIPYFQRFVERFPDLPTLAAAPEPEVMRLWAGLGYYARARNLHACAQRVVADHGGDFPQAFDAVLALPGIGRSTAGAILAQAFGQRQAILDANVKRVLARWAGIAGYPGETAVQARLWALSESLLPTHRLPDYTQALMDLGATRCTARQPRCGDCPLADDCLARVHGRTAELPGRKPAPARARPHRHAWLLLAHNAAGEYLLERRPGSGIWGGLWCPPVIDRADDWPAQLAARHGLALEHVHAEPVIAHAFSHYDLTLHPLRGAAQALHDRVQSGGDCSWASPIALHRGDYALPAPVARLWPRLPGDAIGTNIRRRSATRRPP